jgi:anti-sigma B factor antagonist
MEETLNCMIAETDRGSAEDAPKLRAKTRKLDDVTVIRCRGKLVWGIQVAVLFDEIKGMMQHSHQIVIDLEGVETVDASGLGELVSVAVAAQTGGCSIKLAAPGRFIRHVLSLTGLTTVFGIYPTMDAAILAFGEHSAAATTGSRI